jgi:chromosome segregation ATPase
LEDINARSAEYKSREVALQLQLDDTRAGNTHLLESREEMQAVTQELYAELQSSLTAMKQLASEKEHLKGELSKVNGKGEWSQEQLVRNLESERKRVRSFEGTIEELRREIDATKAELNATEASSQEAKLKTDEMMVQFDRITGELNRARRRNESLASENTALVSRIQHITRYANYDCHAMNIFILVL